ncbi:MAG: class I SAM-dependent methyltransferase [Actinomycetota bacterium]|nr:class I SAM-dependent methyltransferase [Actinomycetota bacterium]
MRTSRARGSTSVDGPAGARWRKLVRARLGEMERLQPGRGAVGAAFWDSRAKRFASRLSPGTATSDPFYRRLRRATGRRSTVLDVGAGPGRFTLALAPHVAAVTAVDPSGAMLDICRRQARRLGLDNVTCIHARWEDAEVAPADVAFSSYVLPLIADAARFLRKLDAAARQRAFLYLGAFSLDAVMDPLWRHFHGRPRKPGPTYLDAVDVLRELGLSPEVEVVEVPSRARFKNAAEAAKDYRDQLCLPDTPEVRKELRGLLADWLVPRDGALGPPLKSVPAAIVSWRRGG